MGDPGSLQPKLAETMNNIDRLRMEIHKNEVDLLFSSCLKINSFINFIMIGWFLLEFIFKYLFNVMVYDLKVSCHLVYNH